ncbi:MAG: hypothetical protein ACPLPR_08590 [Bacillota bacterium]
MKVKEVETIQDVAHLLLELGAKVEEEDLLHVTVAFGQGIEKHGLEFTRRLFSVGLGADKSGRLFYAVRLGGPIVRVRVLPYWSAEADLEKMIFPTAFWDGLWRMVRRIRKYVFDPGLADVETAWQCFQAIRRAHECRPRRESLLLQRLIWEFICQECSSKRSEARKKNASRRKAYEKLLQLTDEAPHSLNVLRKRLRGAGLQKIGPGYWRAEGVLGGELFPGWGVDPLDAAAEVLVRVEREKSETPVGRGL